jgi:hypothetical protein
VPWGILWHGAQNCRFALADRQLKVKRPRLRRRHGREVKVPAYEALQENSATAQRIMGTSLLDIVGGWYSQGNLSNLTRFSEITADEGVSGVILVHGLNGDHRRTWQVADNESLF